MKLWIAVWACISAVPAFAEVTLVESTEQVWTVSADVSIEGDVITHAGEGKTQKLPLKAKAQFRFVDRPLKVALPGTVIDGPQQFRSVRQYETATAQTTVSEHVTKTELPEGSNRILAEGHSDGMIRYCLTSLLTRDDVDLLDMPGDPIALSALLPRGEVEVTETWTAEQWATQLLCSLDVVTEGELTCQLESASPKAAVISVSGELQGARLGAATKLKIDGSIGFDRLKNGVVSAQLTYRETASIGTITPGVESTTTVTLRREPSSVALTELNIPLTTPPEALQLYLDAANWGTRWEHSRDWHVYYKNLTTRPQVIIMRLLDQGQLLAQCNLMPIVKVQAGEHSPLEEFEGDIIRSLGKRFGTILDRSQTKTAQGVEIFKIAVAGRHQQKAGEDTVDRPMRWDYYLIANPDGRQLSSVVAFEPNEEDRISLSAQQLIESVQFFASAQTADRSP